MNKEKLQIPPVIFGTSGLGNLYQAPSYESKLAIVKAYVESVEGIPVFDSAGKYGAGLALEVLGQCLNDLGIAPDKVIISNKLAWVQAPLLTPEPTFEKGVWKDIKHDAVQKISYEGILECFEQGNQLLGGYIPQLVSVHDPDEYLMHAANPEEEAQLYQDIIDAYRALSELKAAGKVAAIGVGSKQWRVIERISKDVDLDWVMIANSLTLHSHPKELIDFIGELHQKDVSVINSAVFNGGFLTGSNFYNYKEVDENTAEGHALLKWRTQLYAICEQFGILPAEACLSFGFQIPGVSSVAVSTSRAEQVKKNIDMATKKIPQDFWNEVAKQGLIEEHVRPIIAKF